MEIEFELELDHSERMKLFREIKNLKKIEVRTITSNKAIVS